LRFINFIVSPSSTYFRFYVLCEKYNREWCYQLTFSTRFFTPQVHIIDMTAFFAIIFVSPGFTILIFVTTSLGLTFSTRSSTIDVHVVCILLTLSLCLPFIAVYFMIRTFIFAFFARYRTVFQHPTRILLTFTHFGPGRAEFIGILTRQIRSNSRYRFGWLRFGFGIWTISFWKSWAVVECVDFFDIHFTESFSLAEFTFSPFLGFDCLFSILYLKKMVINIYFEKKQF